MTKFLMIALLSLSGFVANAAKTPTSTMNIRLKMEHPLMEIQNYSLTLFANKSAVLEDSQGARLTKLSAGQIADLKSNLNAVNASETATKRRQQVCPTFGASSRMTMDIDGTVVWQEGGCAFLTQIYPKTALREAEKLASDLRRIAEGLRGKTDVEMLALRRDRSNFTFGDKTDLTLSVVALMANGSVLVKSGTSAVLKKMNEKQLQKLLHDVHQIRRTTVKTETNGGPQVCAAMMPQSRSQLEMLMKAGPMLPAEVLTVVAKENFCTYRDRVFPIGAEAEAVNLMNELEKYLSN